jgi:hypothetical protein
MGGIVCILVAKWIARSWGFAAALMAEFLLAFDLPSFVLSNQIMAEQCFQLMLLLAVVPPLLVSSSAIPSAKAIPIALLSGIAAGIGLLIRPIGILLPLLVPIPFLLTRSLPRGAKFRAAVLGALLPVLALTGWIARNYSAADYLGLSTSASINLYYYRAVEVQARSTGADVQDVKRAFGRELGVPFERIFDSRVQSSQLTDRMNRLSRSVIMRDPLTAIRMTLQNTAYIALFPIRTQLADVVGTAGGSAGSGLSSGNPSLSRFRNEVNKVLHSPVLTSLLTLQVLMTMVTWIGIGQALIRWSGASREYKIWTAQLLFISLIMIALAAGGEADVRFREPVAPLLAILAALGYFPGKTRDARPWAIESAAA